MRCPPALTGIAVANFALTVFAIHEARGMDAWSSRRDGWAGARGPADPRQLGA